MLGWPEEARALLDAAGGAAAWPRSVTWQPALAPHKIDPHRTR